MEEAIRMFAVIGFLVTGASHAIQPRAWIRFFQMLAAKGEAGVIANALLHLGMGSLVVAFHRVWIGLPVVLTALGWLYVVKSTVYLVAPRVGLKVMSRIGDEDTAKFVTAGLVMIVIGLLLGTTLVGS